MYHLRLPKSKQMYQKMNFKEPPVARINDLEIDMIGFHILKMLVAAFRKGGMTFINSYQFASNLMKEGLCEVHPDNNHAVIGTPKLIETMPFIEKSFTGE